MKERLLPKNSLKVLGVAALIAVGGIYEQRQEHKTLPIPSERIIVEEGKDSFRVFDNWNTYEFVGKFHYANRSKDYLAIGAVQEEKCAIAIIRPDKPIIEIYDQGINPYRIIAVNDTLVRYYSEQQYSVIVKDFFYHEGITYEVNRYTFPPYELDYLHC